MEKIENWNEIEAKGMDDFRPLPIGAYECVIKEAEIYTSKESGKTSFRVAVDIATGDFKDYYQNRFDNNTNDNKKWDNNATRYLAYEGDNVAYFKGFITSIENSNANYKWDWDESKLIGKKICGVFQYEEYKNQEGKKGLKVRLNKFRSLDKIKDIKVSDSIKLLDGSYVNYKDYNATKQESSNTNPFDEFDEVVEITDDILD